MQYQHNPQVLLRAERLRVNQRDNVGIDLTLTTGDRVGILGASGSGKTALLRALACLRRPVSGQMWWQDVNVTRKPRWLLGQQRTFVAMLLANPYTSLEPWAAVRQFFTKSQLIPSVSRDSGLPEIVLDVHVRSLSGAARVRLTAAAALQGDPHVLLVDDVFQMVIPEVWARLLNTLDTQVGAGRALVVASQFWQALQGVHYVIVLDQGCAIEWGARDAVFSHPQHPYTKWLLNQRLFQRKGRFTAEQALIPGLRAESPASLYQIDSEHWVRYPES